MIAIEPRVVTSPLGDTILRANEIGPYIRVTHEQPRGPGWISACELQQSDGQALASLLNRVNVAWNCDDRKVAASFFLHTYIWAFVGAGLSCFLLDRRVPDISPEYVAFRLSDRSGIDNVALFAPTFACLPDDPAASHPFARVMPDEETLRRYYRAQLIAHMEPVIAALRHHTTLSPRAMWLIVADRSAGVILWTCKALGRAADSASEVEDLLQGEESPLEQRTRIELFEWQGQQEWCLRRAGCCLAYKLAGGQYCDSCPILSPGEREERRRAMIMEGRT